MEHEICGSLWVAGNVEGEYWVIGHGVGRGKKQGVVDLIIFLKI